MLWIMLIIYRKGILLTFTKKKDLIIINNVYKISIKIKTQNKKIIIFWLGTFNIRFILLFSNYVKFIIFNIYLKFKFNKSSASHQF
jgi:hypothetical protein